MTDPYSVLGIQPTATDAEVKKAYRELARKYHPDNYQNNPLADLAEEKMKEINEAYDAINRARSGRSGSSSTAAWPIAGAGWMRPFRTTTPPARWTPPTPSTGRP